MALVCATPQHLKIPKLRSYPKEKLDTLDMHNVRNAIVARNRYDGANAHNEEYDRVYDSCEYLLDIQDNWHVTHSPRTKEKKNYSIH